MQTLEKELNREIQKDVIKASVIAANSIFRLLKFTSALNRLNRHRGADLAD